MYFGKLKDRVAMMHECNLRGLTFKTNVEHVYTEAEGLKAIDIEARFAAMDLDKVLA
jgi:hypothetical protein